MSVSLPPSIRRPPRMPPPASSNPPRVARSGRLDGFLRSPLFAMQFLYLAVIRRHIVDLQRAASPAQEGFPKLNDLLNHLFGGFENHEFLPGGQGHNSIR